MDADHQLLEEASQHFVRSVQISQGNDIANTVIDALEGVFGKSWKNQLVLNKLSGRYQEGNTIAIVLSDLDAYQNTNTGMNTFKIHAIKAVRALGGMGLVDAKRLIEIAEQGERQLVKLSRRPDEDESAWRSRVLTELDRLREVGFKVIYV